MSTPSPLFLLNNTSVCEGNGIKEKATWLAVGILPSEGAEMVNQMNTAIKCMDVNIVELGSIATVFNSGIANTESIVVLCNPPSELIVTLADVETNVA